MRSASTRQSVRRWMQQKLLNGVRQRPRILPLHEPAGSEMFNLRNPADPTGHERRPARRGFQYHVWDTLGSTREDQHVGGTKPVGSWS